MPNRDVYANKIATLRDFGGGWNVSDDQYNLASKYQPISDNVMVGPDGAIQPRFGYKYLYNLKDGVATSYDAQAISVATTNLSPKVVITWTAHPFNSGDHINFTTAVDVPNMVSDLSGIYSVVDIDADHFFIVMRENATLTAGPTVRSFTGTRDTHSLAGTIIECASFQGYTIFFDNIGEIAAVADGSTIKTRIWDASKADAIIGNPAGWRKGADEAPLTRISYDTYRQTLLVCNGRLNDKPIEIDMTRSPPTQFLVDPSTGSNAFVYPAEFIQTFAGYTLLYGSNNPGAATNLTPTLVDISAVNTSGVFEGNPAPDDAVQVDVGKLTSTIDPQITGVGSIRNQVFVGFYDTGMLGTLGQYAGADHDPDFADQVPRHGTLNGRVIVNVGNDLFMCDYAGVPAFSQSQLNAAITPARVSQFIDPILNKHLGRLSPETLRTLPFAIYNIRDRQYMLFLPKFDEASMFIGAQITFKTIEQFEGTTYVLANVPNHAVTPNDYVVIENATSFTGVLAGNLNGTRRVVAVVNQDWIVIESGGISDPVGYSGGGGAPGPTTTTSCDSTTTTCDLDYVTCDMTVTFTISDSVDFSPVNDETICYVFTFNPELKIRRWTRYRGLQFDCGCVNREGRIFLVNPESKVYQFGTIDKPYYSDKYGEYDIDQWTNVTLFTAGQRVLDGLDVYECLVEHTSAATDTFAADRTANPTYWEQYLGNEIEWVMETPWSDMGDRHALKINHRIRLDTQGYGRFTLSCFVDNVYNDVVSKLMEPSADPTFLSPTAQISWISSGAGDISGIAPIGATDRNARLQLGMHFPFRGTIMKLRLEGAARERLKITSVSMMYQKGSAR